ncbi:MAG: UvrB/UvrC motif-containing protein [Gemmatimonadota bacterium]
MKCESCQEREATIAFTRITGDNKQVLHLCAPCAEQVARQEAGGGPRKAAAAPGKGAAAPSPAKAHAKAPPTPGSVKKVSVVVGHLSQTESTAVCPDCGMTYDDFRKVGRFGCAGCYAAFAVQLQRLLKRIHGTTRHTGKSPRAAGVPPSAAEEMSHLRQELDKAVAAEAYERAAELRDRIAQLQAAGPTGEEPGGGESART